MHKTLATASPNAIDKITMKQTLEFSKYIFSEKEIEDLKRRVLVAKLLRVGETWKKIKAETGAHLQTIALVSKRLKKEKNLRSVPKKNQTRPIFNFGAHKEAD